jgi:hypothetical protein
LYCEKCGRLMDIEVRLGCYDFHTGKPDKWFRHTCPRKRWWNRHSVKESDTELRVYPGDMA